MYEKPIKVSMVLICKNSKNRLFINIMNGSGESFRKITRDIQRFDIVGAHHITAAKF